VLGVPPHPQGVALPRLTLGGLQIPCTKSRKIHVNVATSGCLDGHSLTQSEGVALLRLTLGGLQIPCTKSRKNHVNVATSGCLDGHSLTQSEGVALLRLTLGGLQIPCTRGSRNHINSASSGWLDGHKLCQGESGQHNNHKSVMIVGEGHEVVGWATSSGTTARQLPGSLSGTCRIATPAYE